MKTIASLKDNDRLALEEAAGILKANFPVSRIILFGSKATGKDTPESDMDLLVLTSREMHWREKDALIDSVYDTQLKYDVFFGLLIIPDKEWEEGLYTILPIHEEISRDGVPV